MTKTTQINPVLGHELTEPHLRGRIYDAKSGQVLDRAETLAAFDAGKLTARISEPKAVHPSYHTRETRSGGTYIDAAGLVRELSRDELVALFALASK